MKSEAPGDSRSAASGRPAQRLLVALEGLAGLYEEIVGRSVAKKWAIVRMDMAELDRLVAEEEVLATECRSLEEKRAAATAELATEVLGPTQRLSLSDLLPRVLPAALAEGLAAAGARLRGVLSMLGRVVAANRALISEGLAHFERFFREVQRAHAPQAVTYSRRGTVAVRDPGATEVRLSFVDREV